MKTTMIIMKKKSIKYFTNNKQNSKWYEPERQEMFRSTGSCQWFTIPVVWQQWHGCGI